jgi:hypothetical protein
MAIEIPRLPQEFWTDFSLLVCLFLSQSYRFDWIDVRYWKHHELFVRSWLGFIGWRPDRTWVWLCVVGKGVRGHRPLNHVICHVVYHRHTRGRNDTSRYSDVSGWYTTWRMTYKNEWRNTSTCVRGYWLMGVSFHSVTKAYLCIPVQFLALVHREVNTLSGISYIRQHWCQEDKLQRF